MHFAAEKCINTSGEVRSTEGGCMSTVGACNVIKCFDAFEDLRAGRRNPQNFVLIILLSGAWSLMCFPDA